MICVTIVGPSANDIIEQMEQVKESADVLEWRIDLFSDSDYKTLLAIKQKTSLPILITLRKEEHGGLDRRSHKERELHFLELAKLLPDYIDFEYDTPANLVQAFIKITPKTKIIYSYHNCVETPQDIEYVIDSMSEGAYMYKFASLAHTVLDVLSVLRVQHNSLKKVIAIAMGEKGVCTRILQPVMGVNWTYACIDGKQAAPGQLTPKDLIQIYRYNQLDKNTRVFALLGSPITKSKGPILHNAVFSSFSINAVYLKVPVEPEELESFIKEIQSLKIFLGFSVTMPLKEAIVPFVDEIDDLAKSIGAVNTLLLKDNRIYGCNTDGLGALNAFEKHASIKSKNVLVIGAGGTAKAIGMTFKTHGANVAYTNRTDAKAVLLAQKTESQFLSFNLLSQKAKDFDVIVHATNVGMAPYENNAVLASTDLRAEQYLFECVHSPRETLLTQHAKKAGCKVIYGSELLIEQAVLQEQYWHSFLDAKSVYNIMKRAFDETT